ncbi:MAG: class I SAM-dependent methyltransferase [Lentisphaerae bacterium]|nr:class I SAM-dependent methyltransferase [Lentisphaerota bacterium]
MYKHNPENGVWMRPDSRPVAYSEGADAEARLYQIICAAEDRRTLSPELAAQISDWSTEYHFSPARHTLLRPLAIHNGQRVLELGCGTGALTRHLGEIGARVDAVEGSLPRARIAAERCRDLPGVSVFFDDLAAFESPDPYDWVFLVGVLEYAPAFSSAPDPVADTLARAARFLAPHGRLVVAIENKLGLKYFNGCSEDHLGKPYYGLQGLYAPAQPVTFGKQELTDRLARAGLASARFYYPFPDYKLPDVILADEAFDDPGIPVCDLLPWPPARDYGKPAAPSFSELLVERELHANGLLDQLANSFLVVASKSVLPPPHAAPALAWRFEINVAPALASQTTYSLSPDGLVAHRSRLLPPDRDAVVQAGPFTLRHRVGPVPVESPAVAVDFLRAFARHGTVPPCLDTLIPWFRRLAQQAASGILDGALFDATPFARLEWTADTPIPLTGLLARSLQQLLAAVGLPRDTPDICAALRELYRIRAMPEPIDPLDIAEDLRIEAEFQSAIRGTP